MLDVNQHTERKPDMRTKWIMTIRHEDGREEELSTNDIKEMEQWVELFEDEPHKVDIIIQLDLDGKDIVAKDVTGRYFS